MIGFEYPDSVVDCPEAFVSVPVLGLYFVCAIDVPCHTKKHIKQQTTLIINLRFILKDSKFGKYN